MLSKSPIGYVAQGPHIKVHRMFALLGTEMGKIESSVSIKGETDLYIK